MLLARLELGGPNDLPPTSAELDELASSDRLADASPLVESKCRRVATWRLQANQPLEMRADRAQLYEAAARFHCVEEANQSAELLCGGRGEPLEGPVLV